MFADKTVIVFGSSPTQNENDTAVTALFDSAEKLWLLLSLMIAAAVATHHTSY